MRLQLLACAAIFLSGCQAGFFHSLNAPYAFADYSQTRDVQYQTDPALKLDVYVPNASIVRKGARPTIVFFYGGSWRSGSKNWYEFAAARYALKGYVVFVPDYRKGPQPSFPGFVEDSARAFAYAKEHTAEYGGDPERMFLMGHSAGAHIAGLLATDPSYLQAVGLSKRDITGFVGLAGPFDFLPMTDPKVIAVFQGDANLPASQPINFVDGSEPPMLLLHGSDDRVVYPKNSVNLADKVNAAGGMAQVHVYPRLGHLSVLFAAGRGLRSLAPEVEPEITRFIEATQARADAAR